MSTTDTTDTRRVLYLQQIDIETNSRTRFVLKLKLDNKDIEILRERRTSTWAPSRSLEISNTSKIAIYARNQFLPFAKAETLAEISGEVAMETFWQSTDSISQNTTFDHQPATIAFKFRPSQTSESTRNAVQRLQTAMENYGSLMSSSTEQRIDTAIKYGVAVSEMNPFAKIAFNLAKVSFDLLKEQRKYDENVSDLASELDRVLPFATQVLEDVLYDETELLDGAVRKLYELTVDTAKFIVAYAKRSPASRAAKATISLEDHRKIEDLQSDFKKLKEDFDRAVDVAALRMARRNEEFRLLDRLKPTDTANYQEGHSCMDGTRTAILEHIINWVSNSINPVTQSNGSNGGNIFWLYGIPGLGKTSVANSLCDQLRKKGNLGGSFFCRRDDPVLREPKRVLPTLIFKLMQMWAPFRKLVAQALHDDPQLNPESARGELLLKPLQSVERHPQRTLVLVIDALDECGEPSARRTLLSCLLEACSLVHWLKIVVTSRPEHDITSFFDTHHVIRRDLAADDHNHNDIHLFAKDRMATVASRRHLPADWPGEERLDHIVECSGGLFIFVETLYRLVDDPDPEPILTRVLGMELGEANAQLHQLYSTAITSRIVQRTEAFRSILEAVVVVATYRPLCDETMAVLIGLEPRVVRSWVDELNSLLYRDVSQKGGIRARHLSVIEFLVGPSCPAAFRVELKRANAELGLRCLSTMVKELKFNICELESSCVFNAEIKDLEERVELKIPDALQYSCMHWYSHICADFNHASEENTSLLDTFFTESQPLYWLEVLSLMGNVPAALLALRKIKACITKFDHRHQLLFEDTLRFVLAFYPAISTSAPHIYVSALPFMPTESTIWKCSSRLYPKHLDVRKGRMESWPALPGIWQGHTGSIESVAYSPDGRYVASGSADNTIRIWDAETGVSVGEPLRGHTERIRSVAYSPDNQHIVSSSDDGTIRIWDAERRVAVGEPLEGHKAGVNSVFYSPARQNIVSGSNDGTIRIWDAAKGVAVGEPLTGHTAAINSVAYSPDCRHIVSGSDDGAIRIWDAARGVPVGNPLEGHTGPIYSVAYSPNGRHIVSGSHDSTLRIWDVETTSAASGPLEGHTDCVRSVAYSPDGRHVISGSEDNTVRIWHAETGGSVCEPLKGHGGYVLSVTYSPDGRIIVAGFGNSTIRIWDVETRESAGEPLEGHTSPIYSITYSPDGRHVVSGTVDKMIRIWNAVTGVAVGEPLNGHTDAVLSVAYSPDGQQIISGSQDCTIRIWNAETGTSVGELKGHTRAIQSVAYSPDGRHVISGSSDRTIRMWDAKTGAIVGKPLRGHTNRVSSVAYSPDGRHVISGSHDGTIRVWDAETGASVGEPLEGHRGSIWSVVYSPDGQHIVSGCQDHTIQIWDAKSGASVGTVLEGHMGSVRSVAYSPDGQHIISGAEDKTIQTWDAETRALVGAVFEGHTSRVRSVAYSPDGRHVISGSVDGTIRVWDAETAQRNDGRGILPGSSDLSSSHPLSALSGLPIPSTLLDSNGWVRGTEGPLFWIPEDCRNGLTSFMIIPNKGRHRVVRLDFTHFQYGTSWTNIRGEPTRSVLAGPVIETHEHADNEPTL